MADELTKVQECLDQLATQMFACLHWVSNNSIPQSVQGQPYLPPDGVIPGANSAQPTQSSTGQESPMQTNAVDVQAAPVANGLATNSAPNAHIEAATQEYQATLRELAQDLVVKEQQIEMLVKELPGQNQSQNDQERRMRELDQEAKVLEPQVREANMSRETLIRRVEETMMKIKRV